MRHRRDHRHLSRTAEHRRALLRNLVTELFRHERIETSVVKAKEARRLAERMITFAKRGDLAARRHVATYLFDETVLTKLFDTIAPWYMTRNGGYTRILKTRRRLGDAGEMGIFELVKSKEQMEAERKEMLAAEVASKEVQKKSAKGKKAAADEDAEAEVEAAPKKGKASRGPKGTKEARTKSMPGSTRGKTGASQKVQKKGASKASKKG
ncbi:MAG: 50S ribosomal protein L17 [Candidatus Eisenbacteria bacterium]|nr:50S ribosomal protein L17 [Candidatus Eisenbacteria bacterium]